MRGGGITSHLRRFKRDSDGAALVEFALALPIMLLIFGVMIEGARTYWSYQATIAGVRDAVRYVGRSVQSDICTKGGNLGYLQNTVTDMVRKSSSGTALFPSSITVVSVVPSLTCYTGSYRLAQTGVVQLRAELHITYPFHSLFTFAGTTAAAVTTHITDQSRIFGS